MSINTQNNYPGLMSLYAFNPSTGVPMAELQDSIFRDSDSDLQERGRRELVACLIGRSMKCEFTHMFHKSMAMIYLGKDPVDEVMRGNGEAVEGMTCRMDLAQAVINIEPNAVKAATEACIDAGMDHRDLHNIMLLTSVAKMEVMYLFAAGKDKTSLESEDYIKLAKQVCADGYQSLAMM